MVGRMISVIVPSLNEEKYIEPTLKALRNQDYKGEYEIIVVDGGSKDKTVKIAKKYADKVIVVGKGIGKGRNEGAKVAKGDIFIFVDADTILLFNVLTEIKKSFRKKGVVGASCPVLPISAQVKDFMPYWIYNLFAKSTTKTDKSRLATICFACRKDVFEKVGGFREDDKIGEDFDLTEKLSKIGEIRFTEETLAMTSPRRLRHWGRLKGVGKYMGFYLTRLITGSSVEAEKYVPVR